MHSIKLGRMNRRLVVRAGAAAAAAVGLLAGLPVMAQDDTVKIGLIMPMTGPFASTGKQLEAGAKLYMAEHGDMAGGKKVQLIIRDDAGVGDTTRRFAQELIVKDKVVAIGGFGLTPLALATAPVSTQSKTPSIVMVAATQSVIEASPYFIRSSFTVNQNTAGIAEWAPKNGIRKVVTLVSDFGPGIDAETTFVNRFTAAGGTVMSTIRVPVANPDFSPFLQKVRDEKPDALFVFLPAGVGTALMKQFAERGLDKAGIKLIATGDVTEDDILNDMGDVALGVVTSHQYSADHPSAMNKKFLADYAKANGGARGNYMAVSAYDGMRIIYAALDKTKGAGGDALLEAMKGQSFESPRGMIMIDPQTRDIVQDIYIRKVERKNGQLYNVEFDMVKPAKDSRPPKAG